MQRFLFLFAFLVTFFSFACKQETDKQPEPTPAPLPKVLIFYKTAGFKHASIPAGISALQQIGQANNIVIDTTNNASKINPESLGQYKAVVFLSTTGDVLNNEQQAAFEGFIRQGNGFMGIHAATDTEYNWPWYNQLVGAYFNGHPAIQQATIHVTDRQHAATKNLPENWQRTDEWYNFKDINPAIKVLATLDETTYNGGTNGSNHPIAWYHEFEGGRAFYTAGGHTDESYQEPLFIQHLTGGLKYVTGIQ